MANQFGRFFRLRFVKNNSDFIELSENKITFETVLSVSQAPNYCNVRIYNLSRETEKKIASNEFSFIQLEAGYEENYSTIFYGTVKYTRSGRLDSADRFFDITGSDGDVWYNWAYNNKSMASGYTSRELMQEALKDAKVVSKEGTNVYRNVIQYQLESTPPPASIPDEEAPRGRTIYGPSRETFRKLGQNYGFNWSIQQGKIDFLPYTVYREGANQFIDINAATGLIGYPTVEIDGIKVKVLLNPSIRPGSRIRIDNTSLIGFLNNARYSSIQNDIPVEVLRRNDDGYYKVWYINHKGDTRGQEWYTNLICTSIDGELTRAAADVRIFGSAGNYTNAQPNAQSNPGQ